MEIIFSNVSSKNLKIRDLNLKILNNQITGILNDNYKIIESILTSKIDYTGNILFNNKRLSIYQENLISYIDLTNNIYLTKQVKDEFYLIKRKITNITNEEYLSKIVSTLNLVNLDKEYLEKNINTLSNVEKKLLKIALNLVIDPDIIIFKEPFKDLDKKHINILTKIIKLLKKEYQKTIILITNDINVLYELTSNLIIFKNNDILISDKTKVIFNDIENLINNDISLPNIIEFNQIAKKYNKNLKNYIDIKDLIKDVYKNVQENRKET